MSDLTPQRMREAADTIAELNRSQGLGPNASVPPAYLRREADRMEVDK